MEVANIILAALGAFSWIAWALMHKGKWMWSIAPLTVFLHVIVFYVVRLYFGSQDLLQEMRLFLNAWSSGLRFHELILMTGMGIALAWKRVVLWITQRSLLR